MMTATNNGAAHGADDRFPPWRLKKPLASASDGELRLHANICMEWAEACEYLVIGGVGFEVFLAAVSLPHAYERWFMVAANAIVALGIYFELFFSKLASQDQSELTRRSDLRVAEADQRAAEALREAEKIKSDAAWRYLGRDTMLALKEILDGMPAASIRFIYLANDPESQYFARQFQLVFGLAKWRTKLVAASFSAISFGIRVPHLLGEDRAISTGIQVALFKVKIGFTMEEVPSCFMATEEAGPELSPPVARVYIGPKDTSFME
jgi:hypothetical protein